MSLLGNILWILLGGFLIALEYLVAGILLVITIIGIPFGFQCLKLTMLALVPFGKAVVPSEKSVGCSSTILNVIWMLTGGLLIALSHLVLALVFAVTIVGLPFARQHMKLAGLALSPFGKDIVSGDG